MVEDVAETNVTRPGFSRLALATYAIAVGLIVIDQLAKGWFLGLGLLEGESLPVWGPLHFTLVWNKGFSFGLLNGAHEVFRWLLTGFSLAVSIALVLWARRSTRRVVAVGIGLVIAGAIGNAIDRIRYGAVVDFIDVQKIGFFPWIFNVADSAITIGVILLLLDSLRKEPAT